MNKPTTVNILGKEYQIFYVDNPAEVDIYKRESLWGQIDYWTRTIRIYDNGSQDGDIWHNLWHEILHGIIDALHITDISSLGKDKENEIVDLLALGIMDVISRNYWME
jgi:hypothetical protein